MRRHTLSARARDAAGNTATATNVSVTVSNTDTTPPTVSITSPAAGATVTGSVSITATASDNVAVAGVQFLLDGANLGSEVTGAGPTYTFNWNTTTATNATPHAVGAGARRGGEYRDGNERERHGIEHRHDAADSIHHFAGSGGDGDGKHQHHGHGVG